MGKPLTLMPQPNTTQAARHAAELALCDAGELPVRYSRNGRLTTPAQQALLLRARVLLVGLGGLGGHVLDGLLRMGVGHITGVDGDIFEESNLNRQLLCSSETLGMSKALAAAGHAHRVNAAVDFVPVPNFVRGTAMRALVNSTLMESTGKTQGFTVVVDALGGLDDRQTLHEAAQTAGIPVVTAGIAGLTGWVQVLRTGDTGPMSYFSQSSLVPTSPMDKKTPTTHKKMPDAVKTALPTSAEQLLGNLAPTVMVAAGLQCARLYSLLTGAHCDAEMLIFDVHDTYFTSIKL